MQLIKNFHNNTLEFFQGIGLTFILFLFLFLTNPVTGIAQDTSEEQNKKIMTLNAVDTIQTDSSKVIEDAPLDINQNRGLFIVTPDQKMQLRILGSVRYLIVYDNLKLQSKNSLNTHEIPIPGTNQKLPNFYNGLEQTRLGFEVTRKTNKDNVFIRLETDFAGNNGFRIRHAYGQTHRFLLGQTWSLFSHINALPPTVDFSGPTGSTVVRTPQIRYSVPNLLAETNFAFGLEYSPTNLDLPDSIRVETFQLIPDITVRADRQFDWGSVQLSGILPILSGKIDNDLEFVYGWGISGSCVVNSWEAGKWYFQGAFGKAISRYFNELNGQGYDLHIDTSLEKGYITPLTYGFYATYEHNWTPEIYSNVTFGTVILNKHNFTIDDIFHKGQTFRLNTFWDITDGAKAGGEVVWGKRFNKNSASGDATRFSLLFYYDF